MMKESLNKLKKALHRKDGNDIQEEVEDANGEKA